MDPYATVQTIDRNTYDLQGYLYVRVVGQYNLDTPFTLDVNVTGGICDAIQPVDSETPVFSGPAPASGSLASLILTDSSRLSGTPAEVTQALADLTAFAQRPDVNGVILDLASGNYPRVNAAKTQVSQNVGCAFARNILATEIKQVIDAYRAANPSLQYIVLAGGADVIPFFQSPDLSGLAYEKEYVPPVAPSSASDAALQSNLVLGQDAYGSQVNITQAGFTVALPNLAVGRLVNTASDISAAVNAYVQTNGVITPDSALVTGYDFVGDAAVAVQSELEAGTNASADTLIQAPGLPPTDPTAWNANQLRTKLLSGGHDIVMLSGHFSAGNLLAADYTTQLSAAELVPASVDLSHVLVMALGCHGGYNIPNSDLLSSLSPDPDWAEAFLRKGAAGYIAATGYAYGDTELVEYGERLFLLVSQQLRTGDGPVSVGQALVKAKQQYLAGTAQLTGIDQKTITQMTLYGFPMMKVDMPGARIPAAGDGSAIGSTAPVGSGPGAGFGLVSGALSLNPSLTTKNKTLPNLAGGPDVTTTYLTGPAGVVVNPFEPIYPKQIDNVSVSGNVLRGVAFRGGTYTDLAGIIPLTSSPTTETSTAHLSYNTAVFYPTQLWAPNYSNAVLGGATRLITFPAQFRSSTPGAVDGTLRKFNSLNLQLFYLPSTWNSAGSPATVKAAGVSAAPNILGVTGTENGNQIDFRVTVVTEGSAGVQAVWILYTGKPGSAYHGTWAPLDLVRDPNDSKLWKGSLLLGPGEAAEDVLFMAQAVGGAGLTTLATNLGAYYNVNGQNAGQNPPPAPTTLDLVAPPANGTYLQTSSFTALLRSNGVAISGQLVSIDVNGQQAFGLTGADGKVTLSLNLLSRPGNYTLQAKFGGNASYLGSNDTSAFTINKDGTSLSLTPASATVLANQSTPFMATLSDSLNRPLGGKSVFFVIRSGATTVFAKSVITDFQGRAPLGAVSLTAGNYSVDAYFSGSIPVAPPVTLTDDYYTNSSQTGRSLTIVSDSTPPTITASAFKADNSPYTAGTWTNQTVTVRFTCADADSGVASCPADQVFSADGVFTATGSATDNAGNTASASFGLIKIDKTAPSLTASVSPNPVYLNGAATATAVATDAGSGIATQSCGSVLTNTVGSKTVTCTATDNAGNIATVAASYRVIYRFDGFLQPINDTGHAQLCGPNCVVSIFKGGSTIPVKFQLKDANGVVVQSVSLPVWVTPQRGAATNAVVDESVYTDPASTGNTFRLDGSQYIYNWSTKGFTAGYYWRIGVRLDDGQTYYVIIGLR